MSFRVGPMSSQTRSRIQPVCAGAYFIPERSSMSAERLFGKTAKRITLEIVNKINMLQNGMISSGGRSAHLSLHLRDLRLADHFAPAVDLALDHGGKLRRGIGFGRVADEGELRLHVRQSDDADQFAV